MTNDTLYIDTYVDATLAKQIGKVGHPDFGQFFIFFSFTSESEFSTSEAIFLLAACLTGFLLAMLILYLIIPSYSFQLKYTKNTKIWGFFFLK
jgi:hypothetical protein